MNLLQYFPDFPQALIFVAAIGIALGVVFFSTFRKRIPKGKFGALLLLITSFCASCFAIIVVMAIMIAIVLISEPCRRTSLDVFNTFNAHIKDVCLERDTMAECPRTEGDLRAFNPKQFDALKQCSTTQYAFDASANTVRWSVKLPLENTILVSGINYPSFGNMSKKEAIDYGVWK